MKSLFVSSSKKGSALIISMLITIVISVIAIYLLDKIIPFAQDIKGIENGNISYYRANTALDEALLSMSGSTPWYETGSSASLLSNGSGIVYKVTANGFLLPVPGQGNSEYNTNWSVLAPGKPIQLILKSSSAIGWGNAGTYFSFRVPDLNGDGNPETLSGGGTREIINWTLSASGETLQANGSQIMANTASSGNVSFNGKQGLTLFGSSFTFNNFYTSYCTPSPKICTLKLTLVNPLLLTDNITIAPYIEYNAHFNQSIPLQSAVVEGQGYAGGFRKNISRLIQQMTTSEALDFTVFQ